MMDCKCIECLEAGSPPPGDLLARCRWIKVIKDSNSSTGYRCNYDKYGWIEAWGSAEMIVDKYPEGYRLADCNECKHKLTCLVMPYVVRKFESK